MNPTSIRRLVFSTGLLFVTCHALAQRQLENLGRGVIAMRTNATQVYVGWRLLGTDPDNAGFNLYRVTGGVTNKLNGNPLTNSTDYVDAPANLAVANAYFVEPVFNGIPQPPSAAYTLPANAPTQQYLNIPLQLPPGGTAYDGVPYTYNANDCSVGDVDGDGEYEIIVKWDPSNSQDNSFSGFTGNTYLDCYKLNGTRLWRIDLGPNIRSGAHYMDFMVYDFDGDGKAELMCRTAPGAKDGAGNYLGGAAKWQNANGARPVFNDTDDYRFNNPNANTTNGYVLAGPEFITVFKGLDGSELASSTWYPKRDPDNNEDNPTAARINTVWGDGYGNRLDRFLAGIAFLDGKRPSGIFCRGYYTRAYVTAWDWRGGTLTKRWSFNSDPSNLNYKGQGAHSLSIGDADDDGKDEIIYGAASIDDDGKGLYSTGLGHGDAEHFSDMNPWRPGKEIWMVHEDPGSYGPNGLEFRDSKTGALIFGVDGQGADVGRGVAYDIDPRFRGYEMWGARGGLMSATGVQISTTHPSQMNFCVWWDADTLRETLDGTTVSKWNWSSGASSSILSPAGLTSNNGTKSTPCLSADILGDWREEIIWRTTDNLNLRIYTTITPATNRLYTLMHDPQYRCAIAWQNTGYNQPPHPGYFLGAEMFAPPRPQLSTAQLLWRGGIAANLWDAGSTANWVTNNLWTSLNPPAVTFHDGDSVLFDLSGSNNLPVNIAAPLAPGDVTVYGYGDYSFIGAPLTGTMSLRKAGASTLTLNNTNSYTGITEVSDGSLRINGMLTASPVTARWPGVLGGVGVIGNGATLSRGSVLQPGAAAGIPGTLTISNTLTELGEAVNRFDLSDDATGTLKTNDLVKVFGNVTFSGTNTIEITALNTSLAFGTYDLFNYSGTLAGGIGNLSATGLNGEFYYLTNPPGLVSLVLPAHRAATNLLWVGNASNRWDVGVTTDWTDGTGAQAFFPDDVVRFDSTGSTSPSLTLVGSLRPGGMVFDSANNFTLGGSGVILGSTGLLKTNSGTLTVNVTANTFTGKTILGGGTTIIPTIANGGTASPLGAAGNAASNLVFTGGALRYTGATASTDRGLTLGGGGTIDVSSSATDLTLVGLLTGGGSLTKTGAGSLSIAGANNYSGGTLHRQGTIALGAAVANTSGLGTGSVTLTNGALLDFFASGSGDTSAGGPFVNALIVPSNTTATIYLPFRISIQSALTGGGTLNLRLNGSRDELFGNWSAFTGLINATSRTGVSDFRCNNSAGYPLARINLGASCTLQNRVSGTPTISIGELSGSSTSALVATGGSNGLGVNWSVGGLNTSATFAGGISNNVSLTKVGTGTLTLSGTASQTGTMSVNGGTVLLTGNYSAASGAVTVGASGTLAGTGSLGGATTVNGVLSPGNNGIGTLTFNNNVAFNPGSVAVMQIQKSNLTKDLVTVGGTLTYHGSLLVTNLAGTLAAGDSFKLFNATAYAGAFTNFNLPVPPSGLNWITTNLPVNGTISLSGNGVTNPPPAGPQSLIWKGDGAGNLWNIAGASNWLTSSNTVSVFNQSDAVVFNDGGSNNVAVTLSGTLQPAAVTLVASKNYTFTGSGAIAGTNALVKSGSGTLTITTTNTYNGGTILSNGTVALSGPAAGGNTANNFGLGAGSVTFNGGTLQLYGYNLADNATGFGSFTNDVLIAAGQTATILSGPRYAFGSKVSGGGTVNLAVDYVRDDIGGNWTAFTGTLHVRNTTGTPPSSTSDDFRVATTGGFPAARLKLGTNVFMYSRATAGAVIPLGEFSATTNTTVAAGGGTSAGAQNAVTWRVGGLNTDATNAAAFTGTTALIKEGSGVWTLTGNSTHSGATTVSNGMLIVNGFMAGSAVTIWGGTLGGSGSFGGVVNIRANARLAPGSSLGTLTFSNALTLFSGSRTFLELRHSPTVCDTIKVVGAFTAAGDLLVTNIGVQALAAGDVFQLFEAPTLTGSFASITLPPLTGALAWNTNALYSAGIISVASTVPLNAWGQNDFGQGALVPGLTNTAAIAAGGYHNVALLTNGAVIAWGNNVNGQCNVPPLTNVVAIGAGGYHSLAARADGTVAAWGANGAGQCSVPSMATNVVALEGGELHSLALRGDGTVIAWGDDTWGQSDVPAEATNVIAIAAGSQHSLALRADGTVLAWGGNLGPFGSYAGQSDVPWDLADVVAIAAGGFHSVAVKADGAVVCWGDNSLNQLNPPAPATNVVSVSAGYAHNLALRSDGTLVAWGDNLYNESTVAPGLSGVIAATAGNYHSVILQGDLPDAPQLSAAGRTNQTFTLRAPTLRGKPCALFFKNSLSDPDWIFLKLSAGDGSVRPLMDATAAGPARFYRIRRP
ncbi:MAG: autotransporter-associated beta strand repeat-containing protein [Verrucomicrobiota bacterium]